MEEMIFRQLARSRNRTMALLETITEETADIVPQGFNNSLRWQLGHILTIQERYIARVTGAAMELPESYSKLFENGTKPADWDIAPPSLETLAEQLKGQTDRITRLIAGKLETRLAEPIRGMETIGEIALNLIFHEGTHCGSIMALKKAIARQS